MSLASMTDRARQEAAESSSRLRAGHQSPTAASLMDSDLEELLAPPPATASALTVPAPTSSALAPLTPVGRQSYTHTAMVNLMVERPDYSHAQLAAHFGRPASWLASVLASEQFQMALDARRHEVADPALTATLHERFKALAIRTSNVMMTKMDSTDVTDFMVLKSGEIAIKALGMGQKGSEQAPAPTAAAPSTDTLAERLLAMMDHKQAQGTIDVEGTISDV